MANLKKNYITEDGIPERKRNNYYVSCHETWFLLKGFWVPARFVKYA